MVAEQARVDDRRRRRFALAANFLVPDYLVGGIGGELGPEILIRPRIKNVM
jgi:hypothetical protein